MYSLFAPILKEVAVKTGDISQGSMFRAQTRSLREDRSKEKNKGETLEEKVDLSTKRAPVIPSATASYDDVLQLLYGIDFSNFKNVEWISKEGTARLQQLLQGPEHASTPAV